MTRLWLFVVAGWMGCFVLAAQGVPVKYSDLLKEEAFAQGTPEQRLAIVNQKVVNKVIASYDISGDVMTRMFLECLQPETDPAARLTLYGKLREKFPQLTQTYDLETNLTLEFLASTPEGQKGDLVGMMRHVLRLQDAKKITWPVVAPLHTGMLCAHLATHAEYQKMSPRDKTLYIRRLSTEGVVGDMTATHFANGLVANVMVATPPEQRKEVYLDYSSILDFFTRSAIRDGFEQ